MNVSSAQEAVREWYAIGVGSPEAMRALGDGTGPIPASIDSEVVTDNLDEIPGHFVGHDGLRRWARESFAIFDDGYLELQELIPVHAEAVVSVALVRGRMKETGLDPRFPLSVFHGFRNGRNVYAKGFSSRDAALAFAQTWPEVAHQT